MGNKLSYPEEDLTGKVAIVTGGNTGIGYETAKALARLGAHTFIGCRSKERAEAAIERIKTELSPAGSGEEGGEGENEGSGTDIGEGAAQEGGGGERSEEDEPRNKEDSLKIEYLPLDLSSFQSTNDFVRAFKEKNLPLHLLINNAALCAIPYTKTDDGYEAQFQVNHLSHMLLTLELLPLLLDSASSTGDSRIVIISSYAHYLAKRFDVTKLNPTEEQYSRLGGYNNTKLYNVLIGFALQRRLLGTNITISSVHPGYVRTELGRGIQDRRFLALYHRVTVNAFGRTPVEGAATMLNCAINPALNSQQHFYYDSCRPKQPSGDSRNERFQEELWSKSFEFLKDHLSPDTIEKYGPKDSGAAPASDEPQAAGGGEAEPTSDEQPQPAGEEPQAASEELQTAGEGAQTAGEGAQTTNTTEPQAEAGGSGETQEATVGEPQAAATGEEVTADQP